MATYQITEVRSHPTKFAAMVSFNGKPSCYYEVELDSVGGDDAPVDETVAARVHRFLMREATADEARTAELQNEQQQIAEIQIANGQIVA